MLLSRTYIVVLVILTANILSKRTTLGYIYCSPLGAINMPLVYSPESLRALRTERTDPICHHLWKTLCQAGVAGHVPTRRGCRACVNKQRGKGTETATTKLRCAFFNAQSLRNKVTSITDHITEHDLDIIGLCETWLCGDESDKIFIKGLTPDGYQFYNVPRRHSRGGGVGLLAKSSIHLEVQECFNYTHMDGMEILADTRSLKLRMAIIYRPPP